MKLVLIVVCLFAVCACASGPTLTTPYRLTETHGAVSEPSAYLWTSGWSSSTFAYDYATVTGVDGIDTPPELLPRSNKVPYVRGLLEISSGTHEIEILYKEHAVVKDGFCWGLCAFADDKSTKTVVFGAESGKIYVPFVSDTNGCDWFWIEEWGDYMPGLETKQYGGLKTKLSKPVVGGMAPNEGNCEILEATEPNY